MFFYRTILVLILELGFVHSTFIFNVTNGDKLLCHACKGQSCETLTDEGSNVIACNKFTQLCWVSRRRSRHRFDRFDSSRPVSLINNRIERAQVDTARRVASPWTATYASKPVAIPTYAIPSHVSRSRCGKSHAFSACRCSSVLVGDE